MTQNIYGVPIFFDNDSQLGRSKDGLAGAAEWPSAGAVASQVSRLRRGSVERVRWVR